MEEGPVNWGEQVSLFCSVSKGDHPMKIHWTLNNNPITAKSHDGIVITKTGKMISVLSIDSVTAKHSGNYTCVASNRAGTSQLSTRILVNGIYRKKYIPEFLFLLSLVFINIFCI